MVVARRALDLALDLARMPALASTMREQPLPPDTLVLIRIAAGCEETTQEAFRLTGAQPAALREAAVYYLQQVLFSARSDSHRTLGVQPGATRSEMREHLKWLMKWLHPDQDPDGWESVFAERVIRAWRDAGTEAAEQPFPAPVPVGQVPARRRSRRTRRIPWIALPLDSPRARRAKQRKRVAAVLLVATMGLALMLIPYRQGVGDWIGITSGETTPAASMTN